MHMSTPSPSQSGLVAPAAGFPVLFHQDAMMFIQFLSCGFGIVELDFCCSFSGRSLDGMVGMVMLVMLVG